MIGMSPSPDHERRALVVEDDADIRELIVFSLEAQGFTVHQVGDGREAVTAAREIDPDLITLDLGLPGLDGIEVCRRVREFSDAARMMVTARDEEVDKLIGLETGADDFLAKPFSPRELKARVNAMFRRPRRPVAATEPDQDVLEHGLLRVDVDGRRVQVEGRDIELTRTEFDLLAELMRPPARVWSREALLRSVWGDEWTSDTHLVEVHIGNLRRKLAAASGGQRLIHTVRGVGYRME